MVRLIDAAEIAGTRMTADGYLVADAKVARTGIQDYLASEMDLKDRKPGEIVKVYRPEDAVFHADSMASYGHKPITNNHPRDNVTSKTWRKEAIGYSGDQVARDGGFIRVPMMLTDEAGIAAFKGGKRELSCGYDAEIDWTPGAAPDGSLYDGIVRSIKVNHIALVDRARGGSDLRIGDDKGRRDDARSGDREMSTKTIMVDGFQVEVTDQAEAAITKLQGSLATVTAARDAADGKVAELTTQAQAKDAEIVTLKQAVTDAKVTPAQMRDAAKAYAHTVAAAKALAPTLTIGDDMDEPAIKKAVVGAKLGDAAKGWTDAQVDVSFATLASGVKVGDSKTDPLRGLIIDGVTNVGDAEALANAAYAKRRAGLQDAYLGETKQ